MTTSRAPEPGIGASEGLSLRVSVALLVRVLCEDPQTQDLLLALERRATLYEPGTRRVEVKSQPFGGAIRIHDVQTLQNLIGDFHFDSEESRSQQDFRILIPPPAWAGIREFCLRHLDRHDDPVLETDPGREMMEEFADILSINLKADQYTLRAVGTIVEEQPSPTENFYARGLPTARIYRILEARILDRDLASALIRTSERYSDHELKSLAAENSQDQTAERFNTALVLPYKPLTSFYSTVSSEMRNMPVSFQSHLLDETVAAILEVDVPKYQRL